MKKNAHKKKIIFCKNKILVYLRDTTLLKTNNQLTLKSGLHNVLSGQFSNFHANYMMQTL